MNKLGAMHGNKETAKGRAMQAKHDADEAKGEADESTKHSARTEHTGKFRPRDGGSNGGYDRK
jgi:hypothetical protein